MISIYLNLHFLLLYFYLFLVFSLSKISSITFLFIAIFLMRFSGQGMMSHTATTTISRYFTKSRGKALSTSWFGLVYSRIYITCFYCIFTYCYFLAKFMDIYFNISFNYFLPITSFILVREFKL